jgi:hypothetical protein
MNKYYTTLQYQEYEDENENSCRNMDDSKVFAKILKTGQGKNITNTGGLYNKFYIRTHPNRKLYDPFPKYSITDNIDSFVDKVCKSDNVYKQVTERVFNMYLNFLKTESSQWYIKAQRESSNL